MPQICALVAGAGEALVLPLLATQILWINLVTDSFPALAVGVDPAEAGLMRRAPRDPRAGVITPRMWWSIGAAAVVIGAGTLLVLDAGLPGGLIEGSGSVEYARTLASACLGRIRMIFWRQDAPGPPAGLTTAIECRQSDMP